MNGTGAWGVESSAAGLRERSVAATRAAAEARAVAAALDQRRVGVLSRLDRVRPRHRPGVWRSAAASASRAALGGVAAELAQAAEDLAITGAALRRHAELLEAEATDARRAADVLAATTG